MISPGKFWMPAKGANSLEQTDLIFAWTGNKPSPRKAGGYEGEVAIVPQNVATPRRIFEPHWAAASPTRGSRRVAVPAVSSCITAPRLGNQGTSGWRNHP